MEEDHPLIKGLKEYLSRTSPEQFEKDWQEIEKRCGKFNGTSDEYEEYMRGCFDMRDLPTSYILENFLFPQYVKDKVQWIGRSIVFFKNKCYNKAVLLGFSVDFYDYYYRIECEGRIEHISMSTEIELENK